MHFQLEVDFVDCNITLAAEPQYDLLQKACAELLTQIFPRTAYAFSICEDMIENSAR
jgi:hypothetical protein